MPPDLKVVALAGYKRSGKNTTASLIQALSDENFLILQLADPIKDGFDRISGPGRELHKDLDEHGWQNRQAWTLAGTEARDLAGDPLVWCRVQLIWINYLHRLHPVKYTRFALPDLRFPHEEAFFREAIERMGGEFELWKVENHRVEAPKVGHISELCYDRLEPDRIIFNTTSRANLATAVREALGQCGPVFSKIRDIPYHPSFANTQGL